MSELGDARILRLEHLESRSLLAGSVLLFAVDSGDLDANQQPALNLQANPQGDSARPIPFTQNVSPLQNQPTGSPFAPTAVQRSIAAPLETPTTAFSATTPQSLAEPRPAVAIDAANAAFVDEPTNEASADSTVDLATDEVSTIHSESSSRIIVTETLNALQGETLGPTIIDTLSIANDGYIDLAPRDPFEPPAKSDQPWRLDARTIPLINQIARRAIGDRMQNDRADVVDRLMDHWFRGPGGLIAMDQINLPSNRFPLDAAIVDTRLQSTVALHRSLNFMAGSVEPALSGQVIDAVMASLTRATASVRQPVIEQSRIRIPTMAYPTAAAIASSIVISNRRKKSEKSISVNPQRNLSTIK